MVEQLMVRDMVKLNQEIAELVGAHLGDGSMGFYQSHPVISFFGHPIEDEDYVKWISKLYQKYFGVKPILRKWSRVLGFQIFSKEAFIFLKSLGIPSGRKGDFGVPIVIKKSGKRLLGSFIRGIFDTDGTIYFEKRNNSFYPRIQLKITSRKVAKDLNKILNKNFGIRSTLYQRKERINWKTSYFLEIRGIENLEKWMKYIGFRNIKNTSKIELWKRNLNPRLPFKSRLEILKGALSLTS